MGVIRFGVDNYLVKFDDSYSEQLYAIQGETARSYIFTMEDIKDEVLDSTNVELKMVLFINGKAGIVKSCPLSDIYIEKERREFEESIFGKAGLEELLERIDSLSGIEKQEAIKEYQNILMSNSIKEKELNRRIEELKEVNNDKFFMKLPQGYLQEADKDATYQMFIVNIQSGELLAQKEGSFVVYPNRNFQSGAENLLVDFSELRMSMDKVLEIGENFHLVNDVVSKADEINELYNLVMGMSKDSELVGFSKEKSQIYAEIGKVKLGIEKTEKLITEKIEKLGNVVSEVDRVDIPGGYYVVYSNGYCEIFVSKRVPIKINANYYNHIWYGGYNWTFPVIFKEAPLVSLSEARWSTGIGWGTILYTSTTDTTIRLYNPMEGPEEITTIRFKVSGFLVSGNYKNSQFK